MNADENQDSTVIARHDANKVTDDNCGSRVKVGHVERVCDQAHTR